MSKKTPRCLLAKTMDDDNKCTNTTTTTTAADAAAATTTTTTTTRPRKNCLFPVMVRKKIG